jgi:hypothetical protein
MAHGPIRQALEDLKLMAESCGLTLEEAASTCDYVRAQQDKTEKSQTRDPAAQRVVDLASLTPKRGQREM